MKSCASTAVLAADARRAWGLGEAQAIDIFQVLWQLEGISVIRAPFGEGSKLSGLFARKESAVIVMLNSDRPLGHQRLAAAHEFYHLRYSPGSSGRACIASRFQAKPVDELSADTFAAHLLMPANGIEYLVGKIGGADALVGRSAILRLEEYFGVDHAAVLWRLRQCGYLGGRSDRERFEGDMVKESASLAYGAHVHALQGDYEVLSNIPDKVKSALNRNLISSGKADELLTCFGYIGGESGGPSGDVVG